MKSEQLNDANFTPAHVADAECRQATNTAGTARATHWLTEGAQSPTLPAGARPSSILGCRRCCCPRAVRRARRVEAPVCAVSAAALAVRAAPADGEAAHTGQLVVEPHRAAATVALHARSAHAIAAVAGHGTVRLGQVTARALLRVRRNRRVQQRLLLGWVAAEQKVGEEEGSGQSTRPAATSPACSACQRC